jgi:hypothetical protein
MYLTFVRYIKITLNITFVFFIPEDGHMIGRSM